MSGIKYINNTRQITRQQYQEACRIKLAYELQAMVDNLKCHCKLIGADTTGCRYMHQLHNDNEICNRKKGDPLP